MIWLHALPFKLSLLANSCHLSRRKAIAAIGPGSSENRRPNLRETAESNPLGLVPAFEFRNFNTESRYIFEEFWRPVKDLEKTCFIERTKKTTESNNVKRQKWYNDLRYTSVAVGLVSGGVISDGFMDAIELVSCKPGLRRFGCHAGKNLQVQEGSCWNPKMSAKASLNFTDNIYPRAHPISFIQTDSRFIIN